MTFDEWWDLYGSLPIRYEEAKELCRQAWEAAQENA